jgi:hypothetical protein
MAIIRTDDWYYPPPPPSPIGQAGTVLQTSVNAAAGGNTSSGQSSQVRKLARAVARMPTHRQRGPVSRRIIW